MNARVKRLLIFAIPILVILVLATPTLHRTRETATSFKGGSPVCILALRHFKSPTFSYPVGYEYEMLRAFGKSHSFSPCIRIVDSLPPYLDSLAAGAADIVVVPADDTLSLMDPRIARSMTLDDGTVWLTRADDLGAHIETNLWISHFSLNERYPAFRSRFVPSYNPFKRAAMDMKYSQASPYDSLFRAEASKIGWDWTMIAAIAWQESMYHIELVSRRGAQGLMQMMPHTAGRYDISNPLDPDESVRSCTAYIARLQKMFSPYAADNELVKFTLAAYNAGEGRILECIQFGGQRGVEPGSWDALASVIPEMNVENALDSLGVRKFKGVETINYVQRIYEISETIKSTLR